MPLGATVQVLAAELVSRCVYIYIYIYTIYIYIYMYR